MRYLMLLPLLMLFTSESFAGEADVVDVLTIRQSNGNFVFRVSVLHTDEGWEHYADAFEIVSLSGEILATRILAHPHVNEQPFTRSIIVKLDPSIRTVTIRAKDKIHQYGGKTIEVTLPP